MTDTTSKPDAIAIDATPIIDRLIASQVDLLRRVEALEAQHAVLVKLVDSHQHAIEGMSTSGGIVQ